MWHSIFSASAISCPYFQMLRIHSGLPSAAQKLWHNRTVTVHEWMIPESVYKACMMNHGVWFYLWVVFHTLFPTVMLASKRSLAWMRKMSLRNKTWFSDNAVSMTEAGKTPAHTHLSRAYQRASNCQPWQKFAQTSLPASQNLTPHPHVVVESWPKLTSFIRRVKENWRIGKLRSTQLFSRVAKLSPLSFCILNDKIRVTFISFDNSFIFFFSSATSQSSHAWRNVSSHKPTRHCTMFVQDRARFVCYDLKSKYYAISCHK